MLGRSSSVFRTPFEQRSRTRISAQYRLSSPRKTRIWLVALATLLVSMVSTATPATALAGWVRVGDGGGRGLPSCWSHCNRAGAPGIFQLGRIVRPRQCDAGLPAP